MSSVLSALALIALYCACASPRLSGTASSYSTAMVAILIERRFGGLPSGFPVARCLRRVLSGIMCTASGGTSYIAGPSARSAKRAWGGASAQPPRLVVCDPHSTLVDHPVVDPLADHSLHAVLHH